MNRTSLATATSMGVITLAALAFAAQPQPAPAHAESSDPKAAQVARGSYLVTIMGCNDCHTPWKMTERGPEPDMSRMLSGHPEAQVVTAPAKLESGWTWAAVPTNTAFSGPWGVSFTANLTPDKTTGLGTWTAETFIAAIRTGRHEGQGRQILPPMPWPMYRNATDEDLQAVFAFLQTIPALKNRVPQPLEPAAN